ncbi:MAG: hypothetical protein B6226_04390 [Candidatus Cloacimonetes bacterium 4572_65]|nr:MAG: hypothetical protein B6226_04390 [Candidatus Cloacimonetes bacterium 4572_65]
MNKRKLTETELSKISKSLISKYKKRGYVPYIDINSEEHEVKWATETQLLYDEVDTGSNGGASLPKPSVWSKLHAIYANFLWIILFFLLIAFTILLMHFDFDASKIYSGIKVTIREFLY